MQIKIAIYGRSVGMFWEALTRALQRIPDFTVSRLSTDRPVEDGLAEECPDILIIEGTPSDPSCQYQNLSERCSRLSIIVLDSTGVDSIIRLRDIGFDVLLRLIRSIAANLSREPGDEGSHLRVLKSGDVTQLALEQRRAEVSETDKNSSRSYLEEVRAWLDVCLHQRLLVEAMDSEGVSTPGWAMSADRARALIGGEYVAAEMEALQEARQRLEGKLNAREAATRLSGDLPRFIHLADAFRLGQRDQRLLAFVLAPELDSRYARVYGFLNDDLSRRRPTASILAQLLKPDGGLGWDVQRILAGPGPLTKYGLIQADHNDSGPKSETGLALAPEVISFLLAEDGRRPQYNKPIELFDTPEFDPRNELSTEDLGEKLAAWRESKRVAGSATVIQVLGDGSAQHWFIQAAVSQGDPVVLLDLEAWANQGAEELVARAMGAIRVAKIHDAILVISGTDSLHSSAREPLERTLLEYLLKRTRRLAVHGKFPWTLPAANKVWLVERPPVSFHRRSRLWLEQAHHFDISLSEKDSRTLAATVAFDDADIEACLRLFEEPESGESTLDAVRTAARQIARTWLPSAAQRLKPTFVWDDIVLPETTLGLLRQVPEHVRCAGEVFEDWGFDARMPYGRGVTALFSGVSGTGKTMAAQILAGDLGVELFQVDLAKTVSKYIGETEKNLDAVFDAAEKASAVLLFDEADALFGKRTEVRDAHDRYANVEVAYLLQRMEAYAGLAVLTTNFRQNLDNAFMRRLRFVIDFPAPSASEREAIWERVFPSSVPLAKDVSFGFLARRLELTGGNIQQISLRAAFAAVADDKPIEMRHIVQATRDELHKLGMNNAEKSLADLVA